MSAGAAAPAGPGQTAGSAGPRILLNIARPWGETSPQLVAHQAARAGLDGVGLADSPVLFPDPLLSTERVLAQTDLSLAGPCVLSLGLREPSTVAGALRTLADAHGGRVVCFLGRGESSVRNAGLPVPSLREHLRSLERLVEVAEGSGLDVPLVGAASGPRTIARTSAVLGAVLVDAGTDPGTVARATAAAREVNPDVRVWLFLRAAVAETEEDRDAAAGPVLGSCAARLAAAPEFYGLTDRQRAQAHEVAEAHDYRRHGTRGALPSGVSREAESLVRRRFLATGSADEVTATVAALAPEGIDGVVLAGALGGVLGRLPQLVGAVRTGLHTTGGAR